MHRHFLWAVAVAVGLLAALMPASVQEQRAASGVRVQPVALQVVGAAMGQEIEGIMTQLEPGTTITLLLHSPDQKKLVTVDDDASSIARFTDNQGTNLLEAEQQRDASNWMGGPSRSGVGSFPKISDDGTVALVELVAPAQPAAGAQSLAVQATIVVQAAAGTRTETVENVQLQAGALDVPGESIEIGSVGGSGWNPDAFNVTFRTNVQTARKLAAVQFLDGEGNAIESERTSTMIGMGRAELTYTLDRKVDAATIELTFHENMERVEVPVDLELTLGL